MPFISPRRETTLYFSHIYHQYDGLVHVVKSKVRKFEPQAGMFVLEILYKNYILMIQFQDKHQLQTDILYHLHQWQCLTHNIIIITLTGFKGHRATESHLKLRGLLQGCRRDQEVSLPKWYLQMSRQSMEEIGNGLTLLCLLVVLNFDLYSGYGDDLNKFHVLLL